jgi:hypothetical protein
MVMVAVLVLVAEYLLGGVVVARVYEEVDDDVIKYQVGPDERRRKVRVILACGPLMKEREDRCASQKRFAERETGIAAKLSKTLS